MKKLLLTLLLAVVSSSAMAEWVEVGTTNKSTYYANPTTIRKSGNKVKMWSLFDYNSVQEVGDKKFLSLKGQNEYDCKEEKIKVLSFTMHYENMGGGDAVYSNNESDENWEPVSPDSQGENLWKFACGK